MQTTMLLLSKRCSGILANKYQKRRCNTNTISLVQDYPQKNTIQGFKKVRAIQHLETRLQQAEIPCPSYSRVSDARGVLSFQGSITKRINTSNETPRIPSSAYSIFRNKRTKKIVHI